MSDDQKDHIAAVSQHLKGCTPHGLSVVLNEKYGWSIHYADVCHLVHDLRAGRIKNNEWADWANPPKDTLNGSPYLLRLHEYQQDYQNHVTDWNRKNNGIVPQHVKPKGGKDRETSAEPFSRDWVCQHTIEEQMQAAGCFEGKMDDAALSDRFDPVKLQKAEMSSAARMHWTMQRARHPFWR
ncbi:MAG: hypothetical protein Q9166_005298 [cf. Caloplaca sp. 2 TL-2023]